MFGSKLSGALTCNPSIAEGVLGSAERGGYQGDQDPPKNPLQRLSTRRVYVVTRTLDAKLDPIRPAIAVPTERRRADLVGNDLITQVNQIAANRISSGPFGRLPPAASKCRSQGRLAVHLGTLDARRREPHVCVVTGAPRRRLAG
ncbi:hypothetical protein Mkiyose1383_41910 [Mycobacterium kiyosense]|nr:hypothetical protein SRL2020130_39980 [Mycobacterium kiyosense]GLD07865.1 hypothetical protein Mkiyose1383_41910 [Mycobacterium kiyosense]